MNSLKGHDRVARTRAQIEAMLHNVGLRPTRTRLALAELVFGKGHRHLSAETLQQEAALARIRVALSTIYNVLHQFAGVGLLRDVMADASRAKFDTNTADHHHFFIEGDNVVVDIPSEAIRLGQLPDPPPGCAISRVDVVVRLRRTD